MKILILVTSLFFVQNLNAFQIDPPEEFNSIIKEKPWVFQFSLINKNGISMVQKNDIALSIGKYINEKYIIRVGLKYGWDESNSDYNSVTIGQNPTNSSIYNSTNLNKYGGSIETMYNFMPEGKLQLLLGFSAGYDYITGKWVQEGSGSSNISTIEELTENVFRTGLIGSINFFVHRSVAFFIENSINYSRFEYKSNRKRISNNESISSDHFTTNRISFDNLHLGIGLYF